MALRWSALVHTGNVDLRFHSQTLESSQPAASTGPLGCHCSHWTSPPASSDVINSQSFHASGEPGAGSGLPGLRLVTRRHTRTRPSMPPVATYSPSVLNAAATTESVWPVSGIGGKVARVNSPALWGSGEKRKPMSSCPPDTAMGGLGNDGWRARAKMEDPGLWRTKTRQQGVFTGQMY